MKPNLLCYAAALSILFAGAAQAATLTIFEEDFSADLANAGGASVLNYDAFNQFAISGGAVDLIRSGDFGITCGVAGACVDLDGSVGMSGLMSSISLNFVAGFTYTFEYILTGNQRNSIADSGVFGITGGILNGSYSNLAQFAVLNQSTTFTVAADGVGSVFFRDNGSDNIGAVLDYVRITKEVPAAVPLPASALLLLGGLGGLGALRGRKRAA